MFTKCFFSASKVFFVCEMGAFFAKNVLFFPWKGAFFKCFFFLPKSTTIPEGWSFKAGGSTNCIDRPNTHSIALPSSGFCKYKKYL